MKKGKKKTKNKRTPEKMEDCSKCPNSGHCLAKVGTPDYECVRVKRLDLGLDRY